MSRLLSVFFLLTFANLASALDWPQQITADEGVIVVYQPQPELLKGNKLKGRAAMSLELKNREDPIFGVFWFDATIDTDRDEGTAWIRDVEVTEVRWPSARDADQQRFTAVVNAAVPLSGFEISLERLKATLESAELERTSLENLKHEPPEIIFSQELAVLLMFDGDPHHSDIENSSYERVLNTPFLVVRHKANGRYYLSSGKFWFQASDPLSNWQEISAPPADLLKMLPPPELQDSQPESAPLIVPAKVPTELIVTDGRPEWQSIAEGKLLYVVNTETPWLRELSTNNMYVLLSGRWYRADDYRGPWTFVRADELPNSFAEIPPASDIGGLRVSVAGTPEANDAVMDAQIPQTAAIKRDEATLTVEYDGPAKFEKIPGTNISYAVNTGAQVLNVDGEYFAVDNGVWFNAPSPSGPWIVADDIPEEEIEKIPASSPVYNVTHVHVYESTPEIVYVGYTPGYLWSFPYYGVPVYGTGWRYPPYYGRWYYPRPPTWGFHVGYNPWTGWSYGVSWSNGFFSFGMSWGGGYGGYYRPWGCCGGWYGGGYRGPIVINTGDINIGNNINIGNRDRVRNRIEGTSPARLDRARPNLYNRPETRQRLADRSPATRDFRPAQNMPNRANNVFADRNGSIARHNDNRWETRENGRWTPGNNTSPALGNRPSTGQRDFSRDRMPSGATPRRNIDYDGLNRANRQRQMGTRNHQARPARSSAGRRAR